MAAAIDENDEDLRKFVEQSLSEVQGQLQQLRLKLRDNNPEEGVQQRKEALVEVWEQRKKQLVDALDREFGSFLLRYEAHAIKAEEKQNVANLKTVDETLKKINKKGESTVSLMELRTESRKVLTSSRERRPPNTEELQAFPAKVSALFTASDAQVTVTFPIATSHSDDDTIVVSTVKMLSVQDKKLALTPLLKDIQHCSATKMTEGVPVPAGWLERLCSFVGGSPSADPGKIPNYTVSKEQIIDDIRAMPQHLYNKVEAVLGATAPVYYSLKKQQDTWVLVDSSDIAQFLYVSIECYNRSVKIQRRDKDYDSYVRMFMSVSYTEEQLRNEFYGLDAGSKTLIHYLLSSVWTKTTRSINGAMGQLLTVARIEENGSKRLALSF